MLTARLDKTGRRVLCGMRDCGAVLAYIAEFDDYDRLIRQLYFECGFRPRDGVWARSTRAAERVRRGQKPQGRRALPGVFGPPDVPKDTDEPPLGGILHPTPAQYPVRVRCPSEGGCGAINLLDAPPLRLTRAGPLVIPPDRDLCACCKGRQPSRGMREFQRKLSGFKPPDAFRPSG